MANTFSTSKTLPSRSKSRGYTLIEVMLALVIIMASIIGIYAFMKPANLKAGVEREQRHLNALVSGIQSGFGTTRGSFSGLTVASMEELKLSNIKLKDGTLSSSLGDDMLVRAATVREADDAFDVVYQRIDTPKCLNYIKSFYPQSYTILVGHEQTKVQETNGKNESRLMDDASISAACNTQEFKTKSGTLAFRFYQPLSASSATVDRACGCTPETQTRTMECGTGQTGSREQSRTSTCTGGTSSCPTAVWSTWLTTSDTCEGGPSDLPPPGTVTPPSSCNEGTETRVTACPATQTGFITESRQSKCVMPTSTPTWSAWTQTQNSCADISAPPQTCTPETQSRAIACPSGQGGQITESRSSSCSSATSAPVWGPWAPTGNTCTPACIAAGNCCQPEPNNNRTVATCAAGNYGLVNDTQSSFCATPTSPLQWNAWQWVSDTCQACPANAPESNTQWVATSGTCPAGQFGARNWEREQSQGRTRYYNCPAGTATLPAPSYTAWSAWTDTGATRNLTSTCQGCPAPTTANETQWVPDSSACPSGQTGTITWEKEQTRSQTTTFDCSNGSSATPVVGAWSGWTDTGATRNQVNSCSIPPPSCPSPRNVPVERELGCPVGQTGKIVQQGVLPQTPVCPTNPQQWNDGTINWSTVSNTCVSNPPVCVAPDAVVQDRVSACPAGQTGSITERNVTSWSCPNLNGAPVQNPATGWVQIANSCVTTGCTGNGAPEWVTVFSAGSQDNSSCQDPTGSGANATENANIAQAVANAVWTGGPHNNTGSTFCSGPAYGYDGDAGDSWSGFSGNGSCATAADIGNASVFGNYRLDCVENYGMHVCDYNYPDSSSQAMVCRMVGGCSPPTLPPAPCVPNPSETRVSACPSGQVGQITEGRASFCSQPTGVAPQWGNWYTISNTCQSYTPENPDYSCFSRHQFSSCDGHPDGNGNAGICTVFYMPGGAKVYWPGNGVIYYRCP